MSGKTAVDIIAELNVKRPRAEEVFTGDEDLEVDDVFDDWDDNLDFNSDDWLSDDEEDDELDDMIFDDEDDD